MDIQVTPTPVLSTGAALTSAAAESSRAELNYPDDQPQSSIAEQKPEALANDKPNTASQAEKPSAEKPDTSDYPLRMPEGVEVDEALLASAVPMLREAGVSSEQAEKLLPFVTQVQERYHQSNLDQLSALSKSWAEEAKADRDIGCKNWKETGRLASVALNAGGAADAAHEARQLLNESGLGNHPAMIRLFRNMGAEIERLRKTGGVLVKESPIEAARRRHQQEVYPNDPPKREFALQQSGNRSRSRSESSYPDDQPKR